MFAVEKKEEGTGSIGLVGLVSFIFSIFFHYIGFVGFVGFVDTYLLKRLIFFETYLLLVYLPLS